MCWLNVLPDVESIAFLLSLWFIESMSPGGICLPSFGFAEIKEVVRWGGGGASSSLVSVKHKCLFPELSILRPLASSYHLMGHLGAVQEEPSSRWNSGNFYVAKRCHKKKGRILFPSCSFILSFSKIDFSQSEAKQNKKQNPLCSLLSAEDISCYSL